LGRITATNLSPTVAKVQIKEELKNRNVRTRKHIQLLWAILKEKTLNDISES